MTTGRPTSVRGGERPLRVALFSGNYNYTVDGANKSLNRLVGHLQRTAGCEVRVYSPTVPQPAFAPEGELVSVPSIAVPTRPDYRLALGLTPGVRRDVRRFKPDLIHLSAPDLLGAAAARLGRSLGVPVVASLHTLFDTYLDYYALGWLKAIVRRRLAAFYSGCDYVLAPNRAIAGDLLVQALPARIRLWERGVDPELFNPDRRSEAWRPQQGFDTKRPVIVFMGRVVMEKGLAVFAETIQRLEQTHGPVQVLVIGDGPARGWFQEKLPGAVFTGFLSGEALATALASGDIFFNPSCTETFGNVNLEAMASGLAMVCGDAPNTRALLQHGRSALLCPPADTRAYCDAIASLIDAPEKRAQIACEAYARSTDYRWPDILDAVVRVYDEALALRGTVGVTRGSTAPPFDVATPAVCETEVARAIQHVE